MVHEAKIPSPAKRRFSGSKRVAGVAAITAVLLAGVVTLPAGATATWLPPSPIVEGTGRAADYRVATGPNGHGVAVWQYYESAGSGTYEIQAATISPTGSVGPVRTLSPAGSGTLRHAPNVAVGPDGTATVIWVNRVMTGPDPNVDFDGIVQAVRISPAGAPGPVQAVSPAGQQANGPGIGVGPDGRSTIVWYRSEGSHAEAQSVQLSAAGDVGPVRVMNPAGTRAWWPSISTAANGTSTVVWTSPDGGHHRAYAVRLNAAGDVTGAVQPLTAADGSTVADVSIAAAADGSSTALVKTTLNQVERLHAMRIGAEGTVGPATTLATGTDIYRPVAGTAADGTSTVGWIDESDDRVRVVRIDPHGNVGEIRTVSPVGIEGSGLSLATAPHGTTTITWGEYLPAPAARGTYALRIGPTGAQSPVERISAGGETSYSPRVAVGANGISTAVWSTSPGPGNPTHLRGAVLRIPDPVPSITSPASATTGVPLAFTASANDALDPVSFHWSFGDGASATGPQATHAYSAPGAFTAMVTATNLLGRSATASAAIGVVPAPVGTPLAPAAPTRPRHPALELRDGTLRLRNVPLKRTKTAKACPKHARVTMTARIRVRSGKRTIPNTVVVNRNVALKKAGASCGASTSIKLNGRLARAGRVTVTLRGTGLTLLKRTLTAQRTLSVTRNAVNVNQLVMPSTTRDACPARATVTVTGTTKSTARVTATKRTVVRLAPERDCRTTTTVKLPARLRTVKKLTVTVSGSGLRTTKRTVSR